MAHERRVVVAAVPEDHVGLGLRLREDRRVVDAGEDEVPLGEMRLVLLALLDRRVGGGEVVVVSEALHDLHAEVAVRHRVSEHGDALAVLAENLRDAAGRLALAGARAHGAHGDDGKSQWRYVSCGESRRNAAPAPSVREARCITCSWLTSEYENTTSSTRHSAISSSSSSSGQIDPVRIQAPCELGR